MSEIDRLLDRMMEVLAGLGQDYMCGTATDELDEETGLFAIKLSWFVETECCDERNTLLIWPNGEVRYTDCLADDYFFNVTTDNHEGIIAKILADDR